MNSRWRFVLVLSLLASAWAASSGYHLLKKVTLGGEGSWDYLVSDSAQNRLFITRATHVMVMDTGAWTSAGDIPDTAGVHGVALAADLGKGFTSNGRADTATVFDLKTLKVLGQVKTGHIPDAILYDPASHRVFTFNAGTKDATAIDAAGQSVAGSVALGGKPEFAAADGQGNIYVNIEDKGEIIQFDARKLTVLAHWPLAPCQEPSGLAIDAKNRRLFSGCDNKLLAVVNADTGKVVATLPIGEGVDATAYDPETRLVFSSNGEGTLTVIQQESADKYTVLENVVTERGARTMALDSRSHNVYTVTADFGPPPAPTADNPHPRRSIVAGSFRLLVLGK